MKLLHQVFFGRLALCLAGFLWGMLSVYSRVAWGWENHALLTYQAFSQERAFEQYLEVRAESLDSFIKKEIRGLARLLLQEEQWARANVKTYPARPSELELTESCPEQKLRDCFLKALRVNPHSKLEPFIQLLPGANRTGLRQIPAQSVTLLSHSFKSTDERFFELRVGQRVLPIQVLATASDEPDYGLDLGLWEDNSTEFGRHYGMGHQPFGNPVLEFSGQAPFHMSFFHEPKLAYFIAGYLNRTYPEYRIHLFSALSRYAFQSHHPYWGYRFAGWALHYIQDLTQPYHSTAMPGASFFKTLVLGVLDQVGVHRPLKNGIQLLTNEHLALENFQYHSLYEAHMKRDGMDPLMSALVDVRGDQAYPAYSDRYPKEILTKEAHHFAGKTHDELRRYFPKHLIQDPQYLFGTTEPEINLLELMRTQGLEHELQAMRRVLADLMRHSGSHSRRFIEGVLR